MGYDVKVFLREIALTAAYQRSVELPPDPARGTDSPAVLRQRYESEQGRLAASVKSLETQIKSAEATLAPLRKAADAVGEELTTAETKRKKRRRRSTPPPKRLIDPPMPTPVSSRPRHWRTPRRRLESHSRRCRVKPP